MVGGTDREGNTVCNELTYLCIDAIETTNLINPSVAVCYTEELPDELLARAVAGYLQGLHPPVDLQRQPDRQRADARGCDP